MKSLSDVLYRNRENSFLFVRPGGNWGDFLIYFGMESLAKKLNLNFKTVSKDEFLSMAPKKDNVIYIHGGGAFNPWSSNAGFSCLNHAVNSSSGLVIYGPCSFQWIWNF